MWLWSDTAAWYFPATPGAFQRKETFVCSNRCCPCAPRDFRTTLTQFPSCSPVYKALVIALSCLNAGQHLWKLPAKPDQIGFGSLRAADRAHGTVSRECNPPIVLPLENGGSTSVPGHSIITSLIYPWTPRQVDDVTILVQNVAGRTRVNAARPRRAGDSSRKWHS